MARLLVHVEGETEETFVNEVLRPHLLQRGYTNVGARIVGNARQRDRRGGIKPWPAVRGDIIKHLKGDPGCLSTTMVDYYGLPRSGAPAWPGRGAASGLGFPEKAVTVESALLEDIRKETGDQSVADRFVPFVVMHEFEGLLFSDCQLFGRGISRMDLVPQLQAIRDQFDTPERIDDSPITAPSKRVESIVPGYQKPFHGNLAAIEIGLVVMRGQCPHFASWLARLEHLAA